MPKYMLILRTDITKDYSQYSPDDMQRIIQGYETWGAKLAEKGLLQDGKKLSEEGGRVLQPTDGGEVKVKDGPYVETKEVVGGVYLITADSYDHAAELCKGHPNYEFGSIEIREIDFMGHPEE